MLPFLAMALTCKCLNVLGIEVKEIELDPPAPTVTVEILSYELVEAATPVP